jgi:uncharacterized Zn-finger protein
LKTALCPRCHQSIDSQAVTCPYCHTALKAFGHPGIPLHRAEGKSFLCPSCSYDADDTCNFPQRPYAQECTLYQNLNKPNLSSKPQPNNFSWQLKSWVRRHQGLLLLIVLLLISLAIAL